ncbi:AraC family transcriptional regulator [Aliiroseovarius sp. YM-037]|uniref:AraC family transcriptional regulator n=1 Tax=Aliiroseovarius sp. YM-037 TaxID=3341728 RepID=UPI003A80EEAD
MVPVPTSPQDIRIIPIARMAQGGRWRVEAMRSYSSDLLLWVTRGQGRITISGRTRGFGAHNAVFIPARTMHGFEMTASIFGTAAFFPTSLNLDLPKTPLHLRIRDVHPQAELTGILESLQREIGSDLADNDKAAYHHAGLFSVWLQRAQDRYKSDTETATRSADLVARYTDMVEGEFRSGRTVSDYARALGITPTHLSRVCNQVAGRSASSILKDRILYEARRLLSETRLPVNQVAAQLGFTSAAYFSRAFQNHTGKTPSAFRRSN